MNEMSTSRRRSKRNSDQSTRQTASQPINQSANHVRTSNRSSSSNQSNNQSASPSIVADMTRSFLDFYHSLNIAHHRNSTSTSRTSNQSDPYSDLNQSLSLNTASTLSDGSLDDSSTGTPDQPISPPKMRPRRAVSLPTKPVSPEADDDQKVVPIDPSIVEPVNPRLKSYLKRWSQLHGKRSDQGQLFFKDINKVSLSILSLTEF